MHAFGMAAPVIIAPGRRVCLDLYIQFGNTGWPWGWLHTIVTNVWGIFKFVGDSYNVEMNRLNEPANRLKQGLKHGLRDQVVRLILAYVT